MENVIVEFDEKDAFEKAKKYFIKICGFKRENDRHKRMLSIGMDSRSRGINGIRMKAIISSYDSAVFQEQKVVINGIEFDCPAFRKIRPDNVRKIYTYVLTSGECTHREEDDITEQVFLDIWGTAYTDAARDLLEEYIKNDLEKELASQLGKVIFLSDAFGPGFYGMDVIRTKDLFQILEAERIGMQVKESGIMLPVKSCAGFYFAVTNKDDLPHPDCRECIGNFMGCNFCKFRPERFK